MKAVLLIFAISIPLLTGYLITAWLTTGEREGGVLERLSLGYGLGSGVLAYLMFVLGLLRVPYSVLSVTLPMAALSALFAALILKKGGGFLRTARLGPSGLSGVRLIFSAMLIAWLLLKISFVLYENALRPIFAWDAWVHWSTGAKVFYYAKGLLLDEAGENFFGKTYRFMGHPIHSPLLQVWQALWLGSFDEALVKTWSALYFIAMLGIVYFAVRREGGVFPALVSAFFLSSLPLLSWHATESYSDLVLGYYALAATAAVWRYMRGANKGYLVLAGLFLAMGSTTKNEGIFFFAAVLLALILYNILERRSYLSDALFFIIPFAVLALPWFAFKAINGLGFGHGSYGSELTWLSDPKFGAAAEKGVHWEIIPGMLRQLFMSANFNLLFAFWLFVTVFKMRTALRTEIKYVHLIAVSALAMFAFVYLVFEVTAVTETTGVNRNALTYAPIFLLSSALLYTLKE